jgi:hypothetical protein
MSVTELIVWPNCEKHGRTFMETETHKGFAWHKCTKCKHKEHESLCQECNGTVDVLSESQASCILKCRTCNFERRELF